MADDDRRVVNTVLGELRHELGERLKLADDGVMAFAWIVDFPLFEWNAEENRWDPSHHMFTAPKDEHLPLLETDPGSVRSKQYDLVCNGYEVGGGSIRIHRRDVQERVMRLIGLEIEEARRKFGHLLEAFEYGARRTAASRRALIGSPCSTAASRTSVKSWPSRRTSRRWT